MGCRGGQHVLPCLHQNCRADVSSSCLGFSPRFRSLSRTKNPGRCEQEVAVPGGRQNPEDKLLLRPAVRFFQSKFASGTEFLERLQPFLDSWPQDVPAAAEPATRRGPGSFDCLRRNASLCYGLGMDAFASEPLQQFDVVTGPFGYVRLLGDRNEVDKLTETLDRIVVDRSGQITQDAKAIKLLQERVPVLVFVNNHFAGYSPETIRLFMEALRAE